MQKKYRVAILGIGGVGGFLGGKLAAAYGNTDNTEIIFVARGNNAQAIKENGLKLITASEEIIACPDSVADNATSVGEIDLLICCTKAYDLESSFKALSSSVTSKTMILPLLNGVDSTEKLKLLFPAAQVLQGCIYIVSKLIGPGIVKQSGEFYSLHFGGDEKLKCEMHKLLGLFQQANINVVLEDNIHEKMWSKFSFISPLATYTSAYNISIGMILESNEHTVSLKNLMSELIALAKTLDINLPVDCIETNILVMKKLPFEATSSMQADFANHKLTELETLTGFVVRKASEQGIKLDSYTEMYRLLCKRNQG
jgi:2-dehydropantoate 2-reductase